MFAYVPVMHANLDNLLQNPRQHTTHRKARTPSQASQTNIRNQTATHLVKLQNERLRAINRNIGTTIAHGELSEETGCEGGVVSDVVEHSPGKYERA